MHRTDIFIVLIWISSLSIALNEASNNFGSCKTSSNEAGLCVPLSDCEYLKDMAIGLEKASNTRNRTILQQSRCGYDYTQTEMVKKLLTCCPVQRTKNNAPVNILPRFGNLGDNHLPGNVLPQPGVCGTFLENRILGGNKTDLNEFPWMALLEYKKPLNEYGHHCGGSLINSRYVLTAAHCTNKNALPEGWILNRVRLGEWDLNTDPDCVLDKRGVAECALPHVDIDIELKIEHELYNPESVHNLHDIALLRLASAVSYNVFIRPICLPVAEELRSINFAGRAMETAGWGKTKTEDYSNIKLKITLNGWRLSDCQQKYKMYYFHLNETQICAGGQMDVDTCAGDSGGPLMIKEKLGLKNVYFIIGVVSYGQSPCGTENWPSVNTNVGSFIDWIQNHLEQ